MGYGYRNRKKSKPLKKTSTRDIAKRALRKAKEQESEEETKWLDQHWVQLRLRLYNQVVSSSIINLTDIRDLAATTTAAPGETAIFSYGTRQGAKIHISGVYVNAQFYWPVIEDSSLQRYPPFAEVQWCVVKQRKSSAAVDVLTGPTEPLPTDVYQSSTAVPILNAAAQPLGTMLFKSMRNGHNYQVLQEGRFTLPAPLATNIHAGELTQAAVGASMGEIPNMASETTNPDTKPTQMSNNVVKRLKIRLHPNCNTRYEPTPQGADPTSNTYTLPLENGIYFMAWTDTGTPTLGRFPLPTGALWTYQGPLCTLNCRTRFTDA